MTVLTTTVLTTTVRRGATAALLALAAAVPAACGGVPPGATPGGPAGGSSSPQAPQAANDARACAIAPSSMVGTALSLPVGSVIGTVEGPVTVCAYQGKYEVIVRFQRNETTSMFTADKRATAARHQSIATVPGLGDSAYLATYSQSKPAMNTLAVQHGSLAIYITSPAQLAAERTLMQRLLAKS
jgi:hypothetical protein